MSWDEAKKFIENSSKTSSVYIGCDSVKYKKHGVWYAKYATVVIVHKDSCRGGKIFYNVVVERDYAVFNKPKLRLLNEVMQATNAALEILDVLDGRHMELHIDINPNPDYKSNEAMKEAKGYVMGMLGIEAIGKPNGFAAMHAADHVARHKSVFHSS